MTPEKIPKKYHIHQDGLVEVEGQRFDGFLLIKTHDPGAGLSVLMTYALNGVRNAISRNLLPVINFEGSVNRYFYDPQVGENIWEYYWEPVMGLSTNELDDLVVKGIVSWNQIASINLKETAYWHQIDPDRIGTFWNE
ncbi:MAG: hypothetical protein O7C75_01770, partial [Verrucomicrobia bacterium]|nr:hypothetical protein [Verrucomicrobiota bacterium]